MRGKLIAMAALLLAVVVVLLMLGRDADRVVFREEGQASVYSDRFQGRTTASGKRFDQGTVSVAHPALPLGSEVTLTNPETGKQIKAEVTDRGPYAKGHDLDLSKAAAGALGVSQEIAKEGDAPVRIEASKAQVEQAIGGPAEVERVERELGRARQRAAREGTPQPGKMPSLDPP